MKPLTIAGVFSNFYKTMAKPLASMQKLANILSPFQGIGERINAEGQEINTAAELGRNLDQPLRYLRWPVWAQVARDHGLINDRRTPAGGYYWIGLKGLVLPFYSAAHINDVMTEAAFMRLFLDTEGKPLSYDSARTRKKDGRECCLSDQIISDLEKALKL